MLKLPPLIPEMKFAHNNLFSQHYLPDVTIKNLVADRIGLNSYTQTNHKRFGIFLINTVIITLLCDSGTAPINPGN